MSNPEETAGPAAGEITRLIAELREGDSQAGEMLFELVYRELKGIARRQLRKSFGPQTLQTTDLVHEAYLRLQRPDGATIQDRAHFFSVAARAMRQIVVDHARARLAAKRGHGRRALSIENFELAGQPRPENEILEINLALEELEGYDERLGKVVELRFFGGLSVDEVGSYLDVSSRTVKRDWRRARAFLQSRLEHGLGAGRP